MSAITGDETDDELRELALSFTLNCPANAQHPACPFRSLHNLYHVTVKALMNGMTRKELVGLFELECEARNAEAAASALQADGKFHDPDQM